VKTTVYISAVVPSNFTIEKYNLITDNNSVAPMVYHNSNNGGENIVKIVDEIDDKTHIIADITYGPKDLPIVLFSAMNFAEKFLECEIENIIYGQAVFKDGKPTDTKICDMVPLYYLNSVTNTIRSEDSTRARQMLKSLLSL
jgi:hypothetical protein